MLSAKSRALDCRIETGLLKRNLMAILALTFYDPIFVHHPLYPFPLHIPFDTKSLLHMELECLPGFIKYLLLVFSVIHLRKSS